MVGRHLGHESRLSATARAHAQASDHGSLYILCSVGWCFALIACSLGQDTEPKPTELAATAPAIIPCGDTDDDDSDDTGEDSSEQEEDDSNFELPDPKEAGPYEVVVEDNVGAGFEVPINPLDAGDISNLFCEVFVQSFGADAEQAAEFAEIPADTNMALYSMYRPKNFASGKKYPVLTWGNGTCALPYGYGGLLKHVASHGFIVIAAYSRFVGDGSAQLSGIDFVLAENENPDSPLYGHVDEEHIGAFGHSQGGLGTMLAAADPRIDTIVPMNGIGAGDLRVPAFFTTGDGDLAPAASQGAFDGATGPAAFLSLNNSDHITLIEEPERVYPAVAAWFRYQLLGDQGGRAYFVGDDCELCNHEQDWVFLQKNLE